LIYSTATKVIGLIKMPLDGNPNKTMGLIAHPGEVADFCASSDGKYLFTCGGEDLSEYSCSRPEYSLKSSRLCLG